MSITNKSNNSTSIPLKSATEFVGLAQSTTGFSNILVNIRTDKKAELTIQQSADKVNWDLHSLWTCDPAKSPTGFLVQEPASLPFFRVKLLNTSGEDMTRLRLVSVLNLTSNVKLNVRQDNTLVSGEDALGEKRTLLTDASGALVIGGTTPSGTLNVNIVSPNPLPTYDLSANNTLTSIDSKVGLQGQNTDFAFFPDATNLTPAIYADGQLPYLTTPAGWVYTNDGNPPNKINWYVFQDATLPQYLVSEMNSIYFVISQLTGATTLPFVGFYTMPNGINDIVPEFAKSKLVFAPNGEVPTTQGEYLFYVKSDPTHIRPEITNRYELTFSVANSSKTLEEAAGERLSLATLSTNSTDPTNSNYFLFQQYGITWVKTSVPLPVNNGKVECNVTLQPVTLAPSTADIGYVNLKAENLLSNPSTFANLQIEGANLQVVDQQAVTFLGSIDSNSSSIRTNTDVISNYNQNMDINIALIKNSNNGIETLTDSINGKITACNTGAVVLTTGTADIGSVSIQGDDSGVPRKLSALNNGGLYALQTNDITGNFYLDTINNFLTNNLSRLPITGNYAENVINTYTNLTLSPAFMYNLNVYSNGSNGTNFLKVYGLTNSTIADSPLLIIPIDHATSVNLTLSGLKGVSGVSVRATANYSPSDNTAPTNSISCNLTYSATS